MKGSGRYRLVAEQERTACDDEGSAFRGLDQWLLPAAQQSRHVDLQRKEDLIAAELEQCALLVARVFVPTPLPCTAALREAVLIPLVDVADLPERMVSNAPARVSKHLSFSWALHKSRSRRTRRRRQCPTRNTRRVPLK